MKPSYLFMSPCGLNKYNSFIAIKITNYTDEKDLYITLFAFIVYPL